MLRLSTASGGQQAAAATAATAAFGPMFMRVLPGIRTDEQSANGRQGELERIGGTSFAAEEHGEGWLCRRCIPPRKNTWGDPH